MLQKVTYRVLAALAYLSILLTGCDDSSSRDNKLIGKWEHTEPASGITVQLEISKNELSYSSAGVKPAKTSYTYIDEDTIKVRNPDTGADIITSYSISGDKLTIAFGGLDKVEFTRVK